MWSLALARAPTKGSQRLLAPAARKRCCADETARPDPDAVLLPVIGGVESNAERFARFSSPTASARRYSRSDWPPHRPTRKLRHNVPILRIGPHGERSAAANGECCQPSIRGSSRMRRHTTSSAWWIIGCRHRRDFSRVDARANACSSRDRRRACCRARSAVRGTPKALTRLVKWLPAASMRERMHCCDFARAAGGARLFGMPAERAPLAQRDRHDALRAATGRCAPSTPR